MIPEPKCSKRNCVHYIGVLQPDGTELTERVVCKAFPKKIPTQIAYGNDKHLTTRPGDNGIQYERKKDGE